MAKEGITAGCEWMLTQEGLAHRVGETAQGLKCQADACVLPSNCDEPVRLVEALCAEQQTASLTLMTARN